MTKSCSLLISLFLTLAGVSAHAQAFPAGKAVFVSKPKLDGVRFDQNIGESLPLNVPVTDEYGREKVLRDFIKDKPVIFVLSYYRCPNLCTLILNGVVDAVNPLKKDFGRKFDIVSLSIDPKEKPELARAKRRSYLAKLGLTEDDAGSSWPFLTADIATINLVSQASGFRHKLDLGSNEYSHPSGFFVVSPHGKISQYFFGIKFDSLKLKDALAAALSEKNGSWVQSVLLFCFHYDPLLSSNGPKIIGAVRIAGVIAVLILGAFVFILFRREPKGGLA
jgi:protein SCO1